jgi:Cof subfamily protein (haloacid dehalogenase superfamily)
MTAPVPIRLVVTDVDGTLVRHDKTLAPSTIAAAETLRRRGIKLGLVSSRPAHGLDVLLVPLGIDTPRAGFNGAEVLSPDGELLAELTIPEPVARETVARMEAAGVDPWVFTGGKWFLKNTQAHYIPREKLSISLDYDAVTDFAPHLARVHKIMGSHTEFELMGRMEAELRAALGDGAAVARSQNYYLDVTHRDANKGFAALSLAKLLGVDPQAMACIGDMPNDTPMFSVCGLAISMGNAPEAVQKLAHAVTGSNEADGWGEAIERFVLPWGAA